MHKKLGVWLFIGVIGFVNLTLASAPDTIWTRTFGGTNWEWGVSVQSVSDGDSGFVITGVTNSFGAGGNDVHLIRTNSSGDTLWTRTFGGTDDDEGHSVQQTKDGGFIIAGGTSSFGAGLCDVYLIRTNSSGNTLWTKTFGGIKYDGGYSMQQTFDGGFVIAGKTYSFGIGAPTYPNVYLIKTNSSGDTLWTKIYGGTDVDEAYSVQQISDSGFIIVGATGPFGPTNSNVYLIRTNSSGDTLWTRTFGGTNDDYGYSVQQTFDGGFIIAGTTYSFGAGNGDAYIIRTDSLGDTLWTKTYGGNSADEAHFIQQTQDSGFIITGATSSSGAGKSDVYLIRTNSSGNTLWTKTFGGTNWESGESVKQTEDSGFVVAGWTQSFGAGGNDVYLIRLGKEEAGVEEFKFVGTDYNLSLSQNPFSHSTVITYSIPPLSEAKSASLSADCLEEGGNILLTIYDLSGRCVKTIINEPKSAGSYSTTFSAKDIKTGIYFVKLTSVCHSERSEESNIIEITKKLILIK